MYNITDADNRNACLHNILWNQYVLGWVGVYIALTLFVLYCLNREMVLNFFCGVVVVLVLACVPWSFVRAIKECVFVCKHFRPNAAAIQWTFHIRNTYYTHSIWSDSATFTQVVHCIPETAKQLSAEFAFPCIANKNQSGVQNR